VVVTKDGKDEILLSSNLVKQNGNNCIPLKNQSDGSNIIHPSYVQSGQTMITNS
jgi:hypothetical protein